MNVPAVRPIGKWERLAYERQERDLERWAARTQEACEPDGYWWDQEEADFRVEWVETYVRHHKGEWAGRPLIFEPWERFIVSVVFGWKRKDGTRRFRFALVEIARKNGKSELGAAIGVNLTVADDEPGAEVYSTATKKDQARIVFEAAKAMVKASPELRRHMKPLRNNIHVEALGAKFEPLGADSDTLDGLNAHGNIVDELHAHKDRGVYDVIVTSEGARRQPLNFMITTAGVYDPTKIGWEQHEYAQKVLEQIFDDETYFAFITAADIGNGDDQEGDDWTDPATWWKANPNLGVSVKWDYLADLCEKAKRQPSFENTFKRLHLNLWTEQVTRWLQMEKWKACGGAINEGALIGRACYGGMDLSTKWDVTAFALAFPPEDDADVWRFLWRFYLPEARIEEAAKGGRVPYDAWARDGWLVTTPGEVIDYGFIRRDIVETADRFEIVGIGYDPWNATQVTTQLREEDGFEMIEVRQGVKTLSEPSKEFEALVRSQRMRHGDDPVARWMASNVAVRSDPNGNIAPDKEKGRQKIDGIVAAIMALAVSILEPGDGGSVYDERGLVSI